MVDVDVYGRAVVPALTAGQATALDRRAQERDGVPERALMESAGRSAALLIQKHFPHGSVVGAVGSGHNGGDALVALRTLGSWGREVSYWPVGSREPDLSLLHGHDVPRVPPGGAAAALSAAGVLVDGLLGTGARGAPRPPVASAIEAMRAAGRPVVALDLPSGVDPDTGAVAGEAVHAALTVCFGAPKVGLLFQPGRQRCGRLVAVEIGFPPLADEELAVRLITPAWAHENLPRRAPDAHKGTVGRILLLAGGPGMGGAALLSARGAVRGGAGLVYVATVPDNRAPLHASVPDAIWVDRGDSAALRDAIGRCSALVAGPGLGRDDAARAALDIALEALPGGAPVLLDADALTSLGESDDLPGVARGRPTLLTPHAGEFVAISGESMDDVLADPLGHARWLASELGGDVLLKGMPSLVAAPDGAVRINTVGSSDLAAAGMGDTLAGVIGALLGNGCAPGDAAALGLFHASRAADLCALGRSLSPTDVADALPRAFGDPGRLRAPHSMPFVTFDQPARW